LDGTVRPVAAMMRCPSALIANSTKRHAASLLVEPRTMQYASACRMFAGVP
jgi:hypothetical protein